MPNHCPLSNDQLVALSFTNRSRSSEAQRDLFKDSKDISELHIQSALAIEELIERRIAESGDTRADERSFAYEHARDLIEINGGAVDQEFGTWFDLDRVDDLALNDVAVAVAYLDKRGLLERCEDNASWVSVRDESEEG